MKTGPVVEFAQMICAVSDREELFRRAAYRYRGGSPGAAPAPLYWCLSKSIAVGREGSRILNSPMYRGQPWNLRHISSVICGGRIRSENAVYEER
jgi:hypothetical protein